jgi:hypothetical protein
MSDVDHSLIHQARRFITAVNVHDVKAWIFCYESLGPESPHRKVYEQLLREFVTGNNRLLDVRKELARGRVSAAPTRATGGTAMVRITKYHQ